MVVVINNHVSGMIRDKEKKYESYLHSTKESGFATPDLAKLAEAYGLNYSNNLADVAVQYEQPVLVEMNVDSEISLRPYLPIGNKTQEMMPMLDESLYNKLNNL